LCDIFRGVSRKKEAHLKLKARHQSPAHRRSRVEDPGGALAGTSRRGSGLLRDSAVKLSNPGAFGRKERTKQIAKPKKKKGKKKEFQKSTKEAAVPAQPPQGKKDPKRNNRKKGESRLRAGTVLNRKCATRSCYDCLTGLPGRGGS